MMCGGDDGGLTHVCLSIRIIGVVQVIVCKSAGWVEYYTSKHLSKHLGGSVRAI